MKYFLFAGLSIILLSCKDSKNINLQINEISVNSSYKSIEDVVHYWKSNKENPFYRHEEVDLNFDNRKDVIIYFHGNGAGILDLVKIYEFDKLSNEYIINNMLSKLENPSFYIDSLKITSFYIGHGGGYGLNFKWQNSKWDTLQYIIFEPDEKEPNWIVTIKDKSTNKTITRKIVNLMIPDKSILPNNY